MSIELYVPDDCPFEGEQWGTLSNGHLRWVPAWYEGGWDEEETQERWAAWCRDNPDAVIPTDQADWTAKALLPYFDASTPAYTDDDVRAALRRYGRL